MTLKNHIRRKIHKYCCSTGRAPTKLILGWEDYEFLMKEACVDYLFIPGTKIKESFMGLALTKSKRKKYVCVLGKQRRYKGVFQRNYLAKWKYDDNSFFKSIFKK